MKKSQNIHLVSFALKKKDTQPESCEFKFYSGSHLGLQARAGSEELLWRGSGGNLYICNVFCCGIYVVKCTSWWKITAKHKGQISQVNEFSAFLYVRRCTNLESLKSLFLRCVSYYLGVYLSKHRVPHPVFHPEFLSGCTFGWWVEIKSM